MKLDHDQLAQRLESALGADAVKLQPSALSSHAVDGKQPGLVCSPGTPDQIAAALRVCSEAEASVAPWGGGTAIRVGNPPRRVDVVIELSRMNRLIEHDDANLTATVEAGMTLADVQQSAARHKQFLALDPPFPTRATVGGIIATNLNGPRRSCYGSVRDLVIGMKVVLATGDQIKAGGKVVKNVAGYDMCKLFVGSLGTLGIMTEATLRMAPTPESAATWIASGTLPQALHFADELSHSQLLPAAVFLLRRQALEASDGARRAWQVAVWTEGFEETVARHFRDLQAMAARMNLNTEILRDNVHDQFWNEIRDFPLQSARLVYRITAPRGSVTELVKAVEAWEPAELVPAIVGDMAMGTVWIASTANNESAEKFSRLVSLAREHRGHVVMLAAPPDLKEGVDVWGSPPPTLSIMREIKQQFDPKGLLNPGRFVGGI